MTACPAVALAAAPATAYASYAATATYTAGRTRRSWGCRKSICPEPLLTVVTLLLGVAHGRVRLIVSITFMLCDGTVKFWSTCI